MAIKKPTRHYENRIELVITKVKGPKKRKRNFVNLRTASYNYSSFLEQAFKL